MVLEACVILLFEELCLEETYPFLPPIHSLSVHGGNSPVCNVVGVDPYIEQYLANATWIACVEGRVIG